MAALIGSREGGTDSGTDQDPRAKIESFRDDLSCRSHSRQSRRGPGAKEGS